MATMRRRSRLRRTVTRRAAARRVELARDALALGLERLEDAAREIALRRLDPLPLADVADDAEEVEVVADVDARDADRDRRERAVLAARDRIELRRRGAVRHPVGE